MVEMVQVFFITGDFSGFGSITGVTYIFEGELSVYYLVGVHEPVRWTIPVRFGVILEVICRSNGINLLVMEGW